MTADQFLKRYHNYRAKTKREALVEILKIGPVEGHKVEAVHFQCLGHWALMLDTAAAMVRDLEIVP